MKDVSEKFKKIKKFRWISIILIFIGPVIISVIPQILKLFSLTEKTETIISFVVAFGIIASIILSIVKFRCPYCGKIFSKELMSIDLNNCQRCGAKLK